ncbi:hypothetical protein [Sinorhizobium alkalisoli]|nr:hypothetical protein [Sinorhizobium alkalisoli]
MAKSFAAGLSLVALDHGGTLAAVIEISQVQWLVAALVPAIKREPSQKLDAEHRWRA